MNNPVKTKWILLHHTVCPPPVFLHGSQPSSLSEVNPKVFHQLPSMDLEMKAEPHEIYVSERTCSKNKEKNPVKKERLHIQERGGTIFNIRLLRKLERTIK